MKNSTEIRIIVTISQQIELDLYLNQDIELLSTTLFSIQEFFSRFKHVFIFIIPNELKSYFYTYNHLKVFLDAIEHDAQTNILFSSFENIKDCNLKNPSDLFLSFPDSSVVNQQVLNMLYYRKLPLLAGKSEIVIKKEKCSLCNGENVCSEKYQIESIKVPDFADIEDKLNKIVEKSIKIWNLKRTDIEAYDLKMLGFLAGVFYRASDRELNSINCYKIHNEIFKDINKKTAENYFSIAFSMFRAAAYSSLKSKLEKRERLSIDWHRNAPHKINGFRLYRVDVMPNLRTGIINSGTDRLLMAKRQNNTYFIAYTDTHDFQIEKIRNRLLSIEENCK